ncbi:MAG: tetratricopeptide repeat protein [Candidatus Hydrogenedentes bacterium]|nr:tetratricopeptide repeat protein [Candidatus Hydrogenedentota bacterium]
MKQWTPWTIALAAACIAVGALLWRQFDWTERKYTTFVTAASRDAMVLLAEDPLAMRIETQRMVRVVAAAAATGHYVTPESRYALAIQYQREGNTGKAEVLLQQMVMVHSDWSWPYVLLGGIVGRSGPERLEEAEGLLRKAVEIEPDWARPYNSLCVALRLMGRYEEAEEAVLRALELAPDDIAAHNNYANLLLVLERYAEAEVHYSYAVELEPDNPQPLYNLACLYSVMEKEGDALYFLEAAISFNENMRRDAAVDPYFDNLRFLPEYQQLVYDIPVLPEGEDILSEETAGSDISPLDVTE